MTCCDETVCTREVRKEGCFAKSGQGGNEGELVLVCAPLHHAQRRPNAGQIG